jgi:hypothetical protein
MSHEPRHPEHVERYPIHKVVAVLEEAAVPGAVAALIAAGVPESAIEVARGAQDAESLEHMADGRPLVQLTQALGMGEEHAQREHYLAALRAGRAVIRVDAQDAARKDQVCALLAANGGRYINYYGRWTVETYVS